nr:hypothetical protein [Tanacetum cinerariifolium]
RVDSSEDEQSLGKDASKQWRKINDIDVDDDITLVNNQDDAEMYDVNDLHVKEVFVEKEVDDKEVSATEKRRKFFVAKRAEEKRNKPPTQAQQQKVMCTYLKNVEGKKLKDLKNRYFDSIQEMVNKAFKRINTFEDFKIELVQGHDKEKRAGEELTLEIAKKQKVVMTKKRQSLNS